MGCRIHLNHLARFAMCHVPCAMCHVPCAMCHVTDPALPFPAGSTATPLTFKVTGREDCRLGVKISLRSCPSRLPPSCVACTQHSGGCVSGGAYAECPQCRSLSCLPNCSFFPEGICCLSTYPRRTWTPRSPSLVDTEYALGSLKGVAQGNDSPNVPHHIDSGHRPGCVPSALFEK